jgi:hypothetical protein
MQSGLGGLRRQGAKSAMMTCSRQPPTPIPNHTSAKHAQHNGLAAEQILLRCVRHPSLAHPRSIAGTIRSVQICPSCPKPILTHEAHNVAAMRPRRLNHSASRAAEVHLQRVACSLRQAVRAAFWNKGEGRTPWPGWGRCTIVSGAERTWMPVPSDALLLPSRM